MFEMTAVPVWAFVVTMIVCLGGLAGAFMIGAITQYVKKDENGLPGCSIFFGLLIMIGGFVLMGSGVMNQHATVDNPLSSDAHRVLQDAFDYRVDQAGFEERLIEETGAENIIINNNNDKERTFRHLQQGDFISFEGIRENSRIEGSVYFSENSMVILVDENEAENKIVIPVK